MDNNLMQMMMQMMMQNQQMMNMMMAQAMQQNPSQATPMMETVAQNNETMSAQPSDSMNTQIADLQRQIESLKSQLEETKQALETERQDKKSFSEKHFMAVQELNTLKSTVSKAEAYLGQKIEDVAARGEVLSGDDYYDEKKEEWDEKGLTNQEKHDMVKKFRAAFIPEEGKDDLIQF